MDWQEIIKNGIVKETIEHIKAKELHKRGIFFIDDEGKVSRFAEKIPALEILKAIFENAIKFNKSEGDVYENLWLITYDKDAYISFARRLKETSVSEELNQKSSGRITNFSQIEVSTFQMVIGSRFMSQEDWDRACDELIRKGKEGDNPLTMDDLNKLRTIAQECFLTERIYGGDYGKDGVAEDTGNLSNTLKVWREERGKGILRTQISQAEVECSGGIPIGNYDCRGKGITVEDSLITGSGKLILGDNVVIRNSHFHVSKEKIIRIPKGAIIIDSHIEGEVGFIGEDNYLMMGVWFSVNKAMELFKDGTWKVISSLKLYPDEAITTLRINHMFYIIRDIISLDFKDKIGKQIKEEDWDIWRDRHPHILGIRGVSENWLSIKDIEPSNLRKYPGNNDIKWAMENTDILSQHNFTLTLRREIKPWKDLGDIINRYFKYEDKAREAVKLFKLASHAQKRIIKAIIEHMLFSENMNARGAARWTLGEIIRLPIQDMFEKTNEASKVLYYYLLSFANKDTVKLNAIRMIIESSEKEASYSNIRNSAIFVKNTYSGIIEEIEEIREFPVFDRIRKVSELFNSSLFETIRGEPWAANLWSDLYSATILADSPLTSEKDRAFVSSPLKILIVSSEADKVVKTGGLGDMTDAYSIYWNKAGHDTRIIMPFYEQNIPWALAVQRKPVLRGLQIPMVVPSGYAEGSLSDLSIEGNKLYLIENSGYFDREGIYGPTSDTAFEDNDERFIFFNKAALEATKSINFQPDIIHCNDWQAGLIPAYLKEFYDNDPFFKDTATVYTIHNLVYTGSFPGNRFHKTGLPLNYFQMEGIEFFGEYSFEKSGIYYADWISTVSEPYRDETLTPEFGFGLEGLLQKRYQKGEYPGIPNFVLPYDNPAVSPNLTYEGISYNYDVNNFRKMKPKNKELFQLYIRQKNPKSGFEVNPDKPLIGIVSRIAKGQKGFYLLLEIVNGMSIIEHILLMGCQFVIAGQGAREVEDELETTCEELNKKYPGQVLYLRGYSRPELTDKILAAADFTISPSLYEPFGLDAPKGMKYGRIAICSNTGGFKYSIADRIDGFLFERRNVLDILNTTKEAVDLYKTDKVALQEMRRRAMTKDFSWEKSMNMYVNDLYIPAINKRKASHRQSGSPLENIAQSAGFPVVEKKGKASSPADKPTEKKLEQKTLDDLAHDIKTSLEITLGLISPIPDTVPGKILKKQDKQIKSVFEKMYFAGNDLFQLLEAWLTCQRQLILINKLAELEEEGFNVPEILKDVEDEIERLEVKITSRQKTLNSLETHVGEFYRAFYPKFKSFGIFINFAIDLKTKTQTYRDALGYYTTVEEQGTIYYSLIGSAKEIRAFLEEQTKQRILRIAKRQIKRFSRDLNILSGSVDKLREERGSEKEIQKLLSLATTAISYLRRAEIKLNAIFSERDIFSTEPVYNLPEHIDNLVSGYKKVPGNLRIIEFKNINVPVGWVLVDLAVIENALDNMFTNSKKYGATEFYITLFLDNESKETLFVIEDNGIGIPKDKLHRVGRQWETIEREAVRGIVRHGLGLAAVFKQIREAGGRIEVGERFVW